MPLPVRTTLILRPHYSTCSLFRAVLSAFELHMNRTLNYFTQHYVHGHYPHCKWLANLNLLVELIVPTLDFLGWVEASSGTWLNWVSFSSSAFVPPYLSCGPCWAPAPVYIGPIAHCCQAGSWEGRNPVCGVRCWVTGGHRLLPGICSLWCCSGDLEGIWLSPLGRTWSLIHIVAVVHAS